ncbi:DNA polymerase III subunit gamma/tau [Aliarcobacter trophiarum LMG 25534]|uniref:DNA polymerase III subunit gamma/tau n=1 Tax=Aliarcobacter trophiarum LMG 25534 TaxID=1032241 RepID=A0AAD0QI83_9BACT|nr:DNA polymerase III subunit gamma/tau [Aliarcobacter trophiarum]AXK48220.1 DNA polymerase III, gamma and tau subunits [Aliarcobacter trophiarum LMG 25534]RXJ93105.1 DNA polymerase III subunit gamma/tau [Aliarcobacter trophiarum LMG 25534]
MSANIKDDRVLALKYRPEKFEDLIGQTTISQTLSLALDSKRLSHAYLFSGLRGSGKTSTARIMAKALLCVNGPTSKPCEICENCLSAKSGKHLDIIEMDAASNRGIDDIKELIEHTKYKPNLARYKVFIIDEVHMLTTQAFNALLKTLEEPPPFVKFILATTDALKLPATILSRTQHFRFNKISQNDVVHHLSHILNLENISFEKDALDILARSGQGSLRDTLTLLDQSIIFSKGKVATSSVVDMLGLINPALMEKIFKVILNKEDINPLLQELQSYEVGQICDEIAIFLKDKMLSKDVRFDITLYDRFFRILSDAKYLLTLNSDDGFVLILTLLKLIEATNLKSIDEIIEQIEKIPTKVEAKIETVEQNTIKEEKTVENSSFEDVAYVPFLEESNNDNDKYQLLIEKVYDRDPTLGECFEKNFIFSGFSNNTLNIISYAKDEERQLLFKYFGLIKTFAQDIFGSSIELDFKKEEATLLKKPLEDDVNFLNQTDSIIEDIEQGAGCVADMTKSKNETVASKELQIDDILNSKMLNRAKELFDLKKITVKSKS